MKRTLLTCKVQLAIVVCALVSGLFVPAARAVLPTHQIIAGNIDVIQNDTGNATTSVTVSNSFVIGDFQIRSGSSRGDFNVSIGSDATDDMSTGLLISSVRQNGRDNTDKGEVAPLDGLVYSIAMTMPTANGYFIPMNTANGAFAAGGNPEWNANVAGAWFPYSSWLAGYAFNGAGLNGSAVNTNDTLIGSPQLVYGTHYIDKGAAGGASLGKSVVNLTSLGIDSRSDGVLLVCGAKNESSNYALSQVNTNDGTWNVILRDTGNTGANGEQDPVAFVFVAKTNTAVISGRFKGDASIDAFSGNSPQFTVTQLGTGRYELKVIGYAATNGVLIISPEGGGATNFDNIVNYQLNGASDGWEIESRDTPGTAAIPAPPLESPGTNEAVCSFVFIPGPTPGFSATPSANLLTTESGGTADFSVTLHTQPSADVTISVTSSDLTEGTVSTNSLTFTTSDWNTPHTVTVTGVDDGLIDGSIAYSVVLGTAVSSDPGYNGINPNDVGVVNADNEGGITVAPTSGLVTTEGGGTNTFSIVLNTQPGANVTIGLSTGDATEGTVAPASVTFTVLDWNTPQAVIVTGVDDVIDDGNITYTIITAASTSSDPSYNGLNAPDVTVTNIDNDVSGITTSIGPNLLTMVEGGVTNYTVVLNSQPSANVTVSVVSGNTAQGGTVSPPSLTFTPGDWNIPQPVTVTGINDLALDGTTSWAITNSVSSGDLLYNALAPETVFARTFDNEATLTLPSGTLIYGTGQAGIGIDGRASIVDSNTPTYNNGTLTIALTANGSADDRLEIRNTGTGPGQIGVSGANVSYGGVNIGTFTGGTGTTPLVVTFNNASTPVSAEALLRNVTFRNVSGSASTVTRSASVTLNETTGYSVSANLAIRVGLLRFADFQEGADHGYGLYTGERDCHLREADPATAYPAGSGGGLFIDWPDAANSFHLLMRFDDIFGNAFGQVPTNAVIVGADLLLRIPPEDSNSMGDGSPLYRMLKTWDPENSTWAGFGNGVDLNDDEARSTFESAFGTAGGGSDSGIGTIRFSVRPDLLVWQSGAETNYGWVMPGWSGRTDGTTVSPGESATVSDRPRLRILYLPAGTAGASFQQDVNNYTNVQDTRIRANAPDEDGSLLANVFVDWDVAGTSSQNEDQVLVRFDNIIGGAAGQIPANATIHAAMLDVASMANNAQGAGGQFFSMLSDWNATNTWNVFVNGIQTDGSEAATTATAAAGFAALTPRAQAGFHSFELTPDVQAWASGTRPNYGWAILPWPNGGDGWGLGLSENVNTNERPRLRVYYSPGSAASTIVLQTPVRTPSTVQLSFTGGLVGTNYLILRAGNVTGPYLTNGSSVVQPNGIGSYTDNSPLPGTAFYRVFLP
jgi:hypothetical protein